ncbi:MAG: zf-HC2 domain-containing protein [Candidatus Aminicenantes bacterium]|nr:zf-HC2 domain-containing protein [Candidatus Aminicenantes bacterium]
MKCLNCNRVKPLLSAYQDNEVGAETKTAVDAHLSACAECSREFGRLENLRREILDLEEVEAPLNFTALVMARVKEKEKSPLFALPKWVYSFVFLIFLVLGLLLAGSFKSAAPPVQDEIYISKLLEESRDLSLINVQDNTFAMLYNGSRRKQ